MRRFLRSLGVVALNLAVIFVAGSPGAWASPPPTPRYQSALSAAEVARLTAGVAQRSIVILRNQHTELSARGLSEAARKRAVDADQAPVRQELAQVHAGNVKAFSLVNAVSASISKAEADHLAANPAVQAVVPDLPIHPGRKGLAGGAASTGAAASGPAAPDGPQQVCPADPSRPLLEPEALQLMKVENQPDSGQPAAHDLVDGSGVKVAFLADGIDINNPDFQRNGRSIFVDYQDFSGEGVNAPTFGPEAFGDAASIAAQGNLVYDLSKYVNLAHRLPPGCNIRVKGTAPGASLVALKILGLNTVGFASAVVQAIDYAVVTDKVDVLNESFGFQHYPDLANDPISLADEAAVRSGVTVVSGSGDSGPYNTIMSPSDASGVISVAPSTQLRLYRQTGSYGSQLSPGGWVSNNSSAVASTGFTQYGPRTVTVMAPGDLGWSLCSPNTAIYLGCILPFTGAPAAIEAFGGASEAGPLTAGAVALIMQAYEKTHGGARPTPDLVRRILVSSATDLELPAEEEGAGFVNALKAVQTAQSVQDQNGRPARSQRGLLVDSTRLFDTAPAGTSRTFEVKVRNEGASAETVRPAVLRLGDERLSNDAGTVNLSATTAPTFISETGVPAGYVLHRFQVPAGTQRLDGSLSWDGAGQRSSLVRESLFDPAGRFAAYSQPFGIPDGHAHVAVHDPAPGTWTAVIWAYQDFTVYNGPVVFSFTTQRFVGAGQVSPQAATLSAGSSTVFRVTIALPSRPGDVGARLLLSTGGPDDGSIPITLRSLLRLGPAGGEFEGAFTGGSGLPTLGSQTLQFQFDVPPGVPVLNLALKLPDPGYNISGVLVDPNHEPLDVQATVVPGPGGTIQALTNTLQAYKWRPQAGRWNAIFFLTLPVPARLQEPFTGSIRFDTIEATATGLPNSAATVLPRGQPVMATIQLRNTGIAQKDFFVDPRLDQRALQPLLSMSPTTLTLPLRCCPPVPSFLVPTHTDLLGVVAEASGPVQMDVQAALGNPDVEAFSFAHSAVAVKTDPQLAPTIWAAFPSEVGPSPANGASPETVNIGAAAYTNLFDTSVTSSSGDFWLSSVSPSAPYSPLTLAPGASGTISLQITPNAPRGTVVHGFIDLDTFSSYTLQGDQVLSIPYSYRVG